MSNKKQPPQAASTPVVTAPVTPPPVETPAEPPVTETALTVPAPTEIAVHYPIDEKLASYLPEVLRTRLAKEVRPTIEELNAAIEALSPELQEKFQLLLERMNPEKEGDFSGRQGFGTVIWKLYQGTGTDAMRPEETPPGAFYTANAQIVKGPVDAIILMQWQGRTLWPKRGEEEEGFKGPLCQSFDDRHGNRYGDCETCPYAGKKYNEGGCQREVGFVFTDRQFSALYEARLNKTSHAVGTRLMKQLRGQTEIWDRYVKIGSNREVNKEKGYAWFTWTAQILQDAVDPAVKNVVRILSRLIRLDTHYTRIARTYAPRAEQEQQQTRSSGADSGTLEDMSKGSATAKGNADFSGDM